MEDVVAVEVTTSDGHRTYFMTWGRIQHVVDPGPIEHLLLQVAHQFAIGGSPASARLCSSLSEAKDAPYFYEAVIEFAHKPIPFGPDYQNWRRRMQRRMRQGKEIYFMGPWGDSPDQEGGGVAFGSNNF
jgi:hypothetical protein